MSVFVRMEDINNLLSELYTEMIERGEYKDAHVIFEVKNEINKLARKE